LSTFAFVNDASNIHVHQWKENFHYKNIIIIFSCKLKKKQFYSFKYIFRYRKQWCFIARARSAQLPLCVCAAVIFRRKNLLKQTKMYGTRICARNLL